MLFLRTSARMVVIFLSVLGKARKINEGRMARADLANDFLLAHDARDHSRANFAFKAQPGRSVSEKVRAKQLALLVYNEEHN